MNDLQARVLTAVVLAVTILCVLALPTAGVVVSIYTMAAWLVYESIAMTFQSKYRVLFVCILLPVLWVIGQQKLLFWLVAVLWLWRVLDMFFWQCANAWGLFVCQCMDIALFTSSFVALYQQTPKLLLLTAIWIIGIDVFGYFGGKYYGKKLVVPSISPKKTKEGYLASAIWVGTQMGMFLIVRELSILRLTLFLGMVYILAITGDLLVSYQKRLLNVKDSGVLLPGHGGLLDRLDSWMFVLPFVCHLTIN